MKRAICLNICGLIAICMIGGNWNAARAQQSSGGPDVVGIKSGMAVLDAMIALKADNPRLSLTPSTLKLEGFSSDLLPSVAATETPAPGPAATIARAGERVTIGFTMPPNPESVWGVERVYDFATAERPALRVTLDALLKKYGPESGRINPNPNTSHITWVYDAQGQPMGPREAQLDATCTLPLLEHIIVNPANDIPGGPRWPAACNSVMVVRASVAATQDPASSQYVVTNLTVTLADGSRYRAAMEATRAVVLNAAKSREKKQSDEVNQRAAPKL